MSTASKSTQRSYLTSNGITTPDFSLTDECTTTADRLRDAMQGKTEKAVRDASQAFISSLCDAAGIDDKKVEVAGRRKRTRNYELHGLCSLTGPITIFLYTARRGQMVAYKTFLKTLIHEFMHHYDWKGLKIQTMHTAGFYKRVNHVYRELIETLQLD